MYLFKYLRTKSHRKKATKALEFVQSSSGCSQSPIAYQLPRADSAASVNRLLIMSVHTYITLTICTNTCACLLYVCTCLRERTQCTITYKTVACVRKLLLEEHFVYAD